MSIDGTAVTAVETERVWLRKPISSVAVPTRAVRSVVASDDADALWSPSPSRYSVAFCTMKSGVTSGSAEPETRTHSCGGDRYAGLPKMSCAVMTHRVEPSSASMAASWHETRSLDSSARAATTVTVSERVTC